MSLTNQIRIGFFALAALVVAIAALAIGHSNRSIEAINVSISAVTPIQLGLKQIDSLLAEARFAFVKYDTRDRITASDSLDLLTRLVEAERDVIAGLPSDSLVSESIWRPAHRAQIAFYSYLDEIDIDRSGDTAPGLRRDVDSALGKFTQLLIASDILANGSGGLADTLQRASNLLVATEITLNRFYTSFDADFLSVVEPVNRALEVLEKLPLDSLAQAQFSGDVSDLSHDIEDIREIRRPVRTIRGALLAYKDAEDVGTTGAGRAAVRNFADEAFSLAQSQIFITTARIEIFFA